ncbi:hypothetical protein L226DRAFT_536009 [Lentinus tigrinus ALCF2SS1-7]|uniref:uncharacterized protein n=1 Tax=Lentinus tigrinus ALCF2SS1-7 TaxID=1328758 RepID=UPI00116639D7|nr:hypothetical protein L226DRAFT_536009 [Lentinus tigrinus ALCF2SS1-7]
MPERKSFLKAASTPVSSGHPKGFTCVFRPRSDAIRKQNAHMHAMTVDAQHRHSLVRV